MTLGQGELTLCVVVEVGEWLSHCCGAYLLQQRPRSQFDICFLRGVYAGPVVGEVQLCGGVCRVVKWFVAVLCWCLRGGTEDRSGERASCQWCTVSVVCAFTWLVWVEWLIQVV